MDLDTLLERFEHEYLALHNISALRRKQQVSLLRKLDASLKGRSLTQLQSRDVLAFIGAGMKRGLTPQTGVNQLGMIRSFATWLRAADLIDDPRLHALLATPAPRGGRSRPRPNPYTVDEIREFRRQLLIALPPLPTHGKGSQQLRAFRRRHSNGESPLLYGHLRAHARRLQIEAQVALALEAGLRRSEILNIPLAMLHHDNEDLIVVTAKQGPGREIRRSIPYTAHARACVKGWLDFRLMLAPDHNLPWLRLSLEGNDTGERSLEVQLRPETMTRFGRKLQHVIGPQWHWHRFRHTAATEWLRSGVRIEKVQRFMGHSNIMMTLRYTEILDSDITDAFAAAEADFAERLGLVA